MTEYALKTWDLKELFANFVKIKTVFHANQTIDFVHNVRLDYSQMIRGCARHVVLMEVVKDAAVMELACIVPKGID